MCSFRLLFCSACLAAWLVPEAAYTQNSKEEVSDKGVSFGQEQVSRWQVGIVVKATNGPMRSVLATIPVPTEWPEQRIKAVDEDVSRGVRVSYRELDGVRQMLIAMPGIRHGQTSKALFTYEIERKEILEPRDPAIFQIPKRLPNNVKRWLNSSPYIESRDSKIRSLARAATKAKESAWEKVEAIYDLVRETVEYREGDIKGAAQALKDGYGDCEELTSLFIAMCRANKIPARMVWVPDHCYPEFYLADDEDTGHWIPCQAAGTRAFGSMPELRPILQKGDNFKVPEKTKPQRYVAEFVSAKPVPGSGEPEVTFVRKFVQPGG